MKKDRDIERAEIWISKAGDDILWAKDTLKDQRYGGVCFLDIFRFEDKKQAAEALELAKEVVRFVEKRIKTR